MQTNDRAIVHMDLDTFFVSCERLIDSSLIGKPVIVGGSSDRGVVAACSYEARKFGVHSAMPIRMARELCPEAIQISGNHHTYTEKSHEVTEIIRERVPLFEKASIDEFYIDLSGMERFFGSLKLASEIRQKIIIETGLPISFGLSVNKTVSKIATGEAKPNNQIRIDYGTEKPFLSPLSIRKIPMVGQKTYQMLRNLGVKKIRTIQEMPLELMQHALGENGISIWKKANAIDNSPIIPFSERKSISTERTFEKDTIDVQMLRNILVSMTENLAYQLRKEQKVCACVRVKIRYSDFNTQSMQKKIAYTSVDHELIPVVLDLFEKIYNKRLLVRLIGINFSNLVHGYHQMNFFDQSLEKISLYQEIDQLRDRYGNRVVTRASTLGNRVGQRFSSFKGGLMNLLPEEKND